MADIDELNRLMEMVQEIAPDVPVGSGSRLDPLVKAASDIPDFLLKGKPQSKMGVLVPEVVEGAVQAGKELVPSGETLPKVIDTSSKALARIVPKSGPSLVNRFKSIIGKAAGKAAGVAGKAALPVSIAADVLHSESVNPEDAAVPVDRSPFDVVVKNLAEDMSAEELQELRGQLGLDQEQQAIPLAPPAEIKAREDRNRAEAAELTSLAASEDDPGAAPLVQNPDEVLAEAKVNEKRVEAKEESPYKDILKQLEALKKKGQSDIQSARKKDVLMNLLDGINKAFSYYDQAAAASGSGQMMKRMVPEKIKADYRKTAVSDQERVRKQLMESLGMARGVEKDKELADYRKRQLDIQEMSAKNRRSEAKTNRDRVFALKKEGEVRRREMLTERLAKQDRDQVERYTKKAEASTQYKDSAKLLSNVGTVEELIKEANIRGGQSLAMLGPRVAKGIAGEVGVLTEADVTRYVASPDLRGSLRDSLLKAKSGQLSDVSAENLLRLVDIMRAKAKEERTEAYERAAVQLAKNSSLSYEQSMEFLDPDYVPGRVVSREVQDKQGFSGAQEAGISEVMKTNNITRDEAIKALRDAGNL